MPTATPALPTLPTATLPPRSYTDPAVFERERERIFRREWHCVAREDQLARPGDYVAFELFGEPLVAVRGDDGRLRVLSGVCRHRWMPVVASGSGNRRSFQCPYHLWTYGLDGRLIGAPDMQRSAGFERARCALPQLAVETWHGFVYTSLAPDAAPLAPRLAGLARALAPYDLASLRTLPPLVFEHDWNWKVLVDNFIESYHHQGPHADTLQPLVPAAGTWAEDADGPYVLLHNPTKNGVPIPTVFAPRPALGDAQRAEFLVAAVFPFHLFAVQPDSLVWYRMEPLAVDRFRLFIHPCVPAEAADDPAQRPAIEGLRSFLDLVHRQDMEACDGVQRGVGAALAAPGPLSHLEKPIAQLARWWRERMEASP
ncbi:MAG: hypothetical protein DCC71_02720 [Proteobacteria bacterium]|nr:MAG: hypothetical protein DCC71_02720 [Pseudomonadota bacterium]